MSRNPGKVADQIVRGHGLPDDDVAMATASRALLNKSNEVILDVSQCDSAADVLEILGAQPETGLVEYPSQKDNLAGPNWPTSGDCYGLGDSQTWGTNTSGKSYTADSRINEAYRWPNVLAGSFGKSLTVTNLGRPAEKISAADGGVAQNIWNAWGSVPQDWTGVVAMMLGYNNSDSGTITPGYFANMQASFRAFVARALIDDYAGIGTSGWGSTGSGGGTIDAFVTTGSANTVAVTAGQSASRNPFYYGDADGSKRRISLTGASGHYVEFTTTDKNAVALFLDAGSAGGEFTVTVNDVERATGTTLYTAVGGNDPSTHQYPHVVWLENLPASATIRLTASSGTVMWQAYGWVNLTGALTASKVIVLAGPTGNQANSRTDRMLKELNLRAQAAVAEFIGWPVYYADPFTGWSRYLNDEYTDISHFTIAGNAAVATAFERAHRPYRATILDQPATLRRVAELLENIITVDLTPATWASTAANGGALGTPNAYIQCRCSTTPSSTILGRHGNSGGARTFQRPNDLISATRAASYINWSLPMRISFVVDCTSQTTNGVGRLYFGRAYNNTTIGDVAEKCVGIKLNNGAVVGQVHDGSTLTTSSTLITLNSAYFYKGAIEVVGDGTVKFYFGDELVWTTALGPTGNGASLSTNIEISATNGGDSAFYIWGIYDLKVTHLPQLERLA